MFNFNEMETSMGYVSTAALHPTDSSGAMALPNYSNNTHFAQRHHPHHHLQQPPSTCAGVDKVTTGDYGDSTISKSSHLSYMGSENVKRFSVNNLLNLVGYTELSRNSGILKFI